jgi:hypothetical protein
VALIQHQFGVGSPVYQSLILFAVNLVIAVLVFGLLDSGMFLKGSARQRRALQAQARRAAVTT